MPHAQYVIQNWAKVTLNAGGRHSQKESFLEFLERLRRSASTSLPITSKMKMKLKTEAIPFLLPISHFNTHPISSSCFVRFKCSKSILPYLTSWLMVV